MSVRITGEAWSGNVEFSKLDFESMRILAWVKDWLTKMAHSRSDLTNDFRRRNTMCDEEGNIKVIDYSEAETEEWDIMYGISRYAVDWANGNRKILDWLTDQFPDESRAAILEESSSLPDAEKIILA